MQLHHRWYHLATEQESPTTRNTLNLDRFRRHANPRLDNQRSQQKRFGWLNVFIQTGQSKRSGFPNEFLSDHGQIK
jgi:hypothetical protein